MDTAPNPRVTLIVLGALLALDVWVILNPTQVIRWLVRWMEHRHRLPRPLEDAAVQIVHETRRATLIRLWAVGWLVLLMGVVSAVLWLGRQPVRTH